MRQTVFEGAVGVLIVVSLLTGLTAGQASSGTHSTKSAPQQLPPNAEAALLKDVKIEQKLNGPLPLDATFRDETGKAVTLGEYFQKRPVLLALVYFQCPSLCNEVLNGMGRAVAGLDFAPGKEFEIVVVSFDPAETPDLAAKKKRSYIARYGRENEAQGWHFLTGDQANITRVTEAAGFNYRWDERSKQFAHGSGIMLATPEGKLSHYFLGIDFSTRDLRLAMVESSNNRIGKLIDQFQLLCFHYDPMTGKYGLAIHRILTASGLLTVAAIGSFIGFALRKERRQQNKFEKEGIEALQV